MNWLASTQEIPDEMYMVWGDSIHQTISRNLYTQQGWRRLSAMDKFLYASNKFIPICTHKQQNNY